MSKYTAEQVESAILGFAGYSATHHGIGNDLLAIADEYTALLREREEMTDEVVDELRGAYFSETGQETNRQGMQAALKAISPMLSSARVPDLENALRMVVAANAMLSEIEDNKTLYEGSPLHSTRCLLAWDNLNTAIANAKEVLAAAPKPETEE